MRNTRGFTLIELMISGAIFALATAFLMQSFHTTHRTYVVVDQLSEVQQNVHALAERIEQDIRVAGFSVPQAAAVCGWDNTTAPDFLFVSDATVIRTADQLAAIDPILAASSLGAPVSGVATGWTPPLVLTLTQSFVDVAADGPDFSRLGGVILVDRNDPNGPVTCGIVGNANPTTSLTVLWGGSITASADPDVVAIPAHVYSVAGGQLLRNGLAIAGDVEDFQVAYFFDANDDRNIDPGEYVGDGVGANYDPAAVNGANLREVRFNLVLSTRDPDPRTTYQEGLGQATENRTVASSPGRDGLRRRVHTSTVRVRNVGNRS